MSFLDDFLTYNPLTAGVYNGYNAISGSNLLNDITKKAPQLGPSPYQGQWNQLIQQLRDQAMGNGPSLAEAQYRKANQDALANQTALSRGRAPGAARSAANNMGNISMGLTEGVTRARLAEQMQAQQQLNAALSGASSADFQRAYANQQAQVATPTQFQQLMGIGGQVAGMAGGMMGGAPPMPMMAPQGGGMSPYSNGMGAVYAPPVPMNPTAGNPNLIGNQNQYQPMGQGYTPWGNGGY